MDKSDTFNGNHESIPLRPNNKIINKQTKTHNEIIGKYKEIIKDKKDFIKENDIKKINAHKSIRLSYELITNPHTGGGEFVSSFYGVTGW